MSDSPVGYIYRLLPEPRMIGRLQDDHPGLGPNHPTNQDDRSFWRPYYFFWEKKWVYHPGHHPIENPGVILGPWGRAGIFPLIYKEMVAQIWNLSKWSSSWCHPAPAPGGGGPGLTILVWDPIILVWGPIILGRRQKTSPSRCLFWRISSRHHPGLVGDCGRVPAETRCHPGVILGCSGLVPSSWHHPGWPTKEKVIFGNSCFCGHFDCYHPGC